MNRRQITLVGDARAGATEACGVCDARDDDARDDDARDDEERDGGDGDGNVVVR